MLGCNSGLVFRQAKLNELRNTLQSRDEMLHVKNEARESSSLASIRKLLNASILPVLFARREELSKLHMELHILAREHCALQLRCRQSEESRRVSLAVGLKVFQGLAIPPSRHEGVADASSELSFLRRQCRLLQAGSCPVQSSGRCARQ